MSNVTLTEEEFAALKATVEAARELVAAIPMITAVGGNVTRQNIQVAALANALETGLPSIRSAEARKVTNDAGLPNSKRTRTTQK